MTYKEIVSNYFHPALDSEVQVPAMLKDLNNPELSVSLKPKPRNNLSKKKTISKVNITILLKKSNFSENLSSK